VEQLKVCCAVANFVFILHNVIHLIVKFPFCHFAADCFTWCPFITALLLTDRLNFLFRRCWAFIFIKPLPL
jgi:hypothetical protein